jgi:hypothetical protein
VAKRTPPHHAWLHVGLYMDGSSLEKVVLKGEEAEDPVDDSSGQEAWRDKMVPCTRSRSAAPTRLEPPSRIQIKTNGLGQQRAH